jgi:hypothetical protein
MHREIQQLEQNRRARCRDVYNKHVWPGYISGFYSFVTVLQFSIGKMENLGNEVTSRDSFYDAIMHNSVLNQALKARGLILRPHVFFY